MIVSSPHAAHLPWQTDFDRMKALTRAHLADPYSRDAYRAFAGSVQAFWTIYGWVWLGYIQAGLVPQSLPAETLL